MAARRAIRRFAVRTTAATVLFSGVACYAYRPRPSWDKDYYKRLRGRVPKPSAPEQFLLDVGQSLAIAPTLTLMKGLAAVANQVEILDWDKLDDAMENRGERGLITVANHASILDDPGIMSAILPFRVLWKPDQMRWSVCSEELCFFHPAVSAYMGAGRVLPITRGGGIFQRVIVKYQELVDEHQWVHIFPEGRCWQEGGTPYRDKQGRWCSPSGRCGDPYAKLGPMKWGIAKVIANAEKAPVVLPFYHLGMENVMPQDHENEILSSMPRFGNKLTVQFGDPIEFDDLVAAYHKGAARRASERAAARAKAHVAVPGAKGDGKAAQVKGAFPHIDPTAPVMELCGEPGGRFRLRIVPPDHQILTDAELAQEEAVRLKLYSAIATRIHDRLRVLEDRVRDRRRQQGIEHLDDKQW